MTLEEALDSTVQEYLDWCHTYCRNKSKDDPIFSDIYITGANAILEALWLKRYYIHKINTLGD